MKVLFIVYYLDSSISVGAQRISYWASNLRRIIPEISVEIITAVNGKNDVSKVKKVHIVPNHHGGVGLSIDAGLSWKKKLLKYIRAMQFDFDWVIMSGGPFMHFGITKQLKAEYGVKVLLDFRDPFARNPRFNNWFLKVAIKSYYEHRFIKEADQIVTVNEKCVELLKYPDISDDKYAVIQNGYDDQILDSISAVGKVGNVVRMVYSGSFFEDRNPTNMLRLISKEGYGSRFKFTHVGRESAYISPHVNQENIHHLGLMSYRETLEVVARSDIGLVFTSGSAFESTTKIFDYIGLGKAILIVTEGELRTGDLHKITEDYPVVYWSKNDEASLEKVLSKIRNDNLNVSFPEKVDYSRKNGLNILIDLIHGGS